MSNHTKGPWRFSQMNWGFQILPDSEAVARKRPVIGTVSAWTEDKREDSEARANAHLIAAAPEMYEAIETYLKASSYRDADQAFGLLRAAAAKAKGHEQP